MPFVTNAVELPQVELRTVSIASSTYLPAQGWDREHFANGVTFAPLGCEAVDPAIEPDVPCDYETPDRTDSWTLIDSEFCTTFLPFEIRIDISMQKVSGFPEEELRRRLEDKWRLTRSAAIAREVYASAIGANPSLIQAAADVSANMYGGGLLGAVAAVEDALGRDWPNAVGMIHVPPGVLTVVAAGGGFKLVDGAYRTPTGHIVVADAGYLGGAPTTGAVTAGRPWIYASAPVYLMTSGRLDNGEPWQRYDYTRNTVRLQTSEIGLVAFDSCTVSAAQIA